MFWLVVEKEIMSEFLVGLYKLLKLIIKPWFLGKVRSIFGKLTCQRNATKDVLLPGGGHLHHVLKKSRGFTLLLFEGPVQMVDGRM